MYVLYIFWHRVCHLSVLHIYNNDTILFFNSTGPPKFL